jgi:hypothetical protein
MTWLVPVSGGCLLGRVDWTVALSSAFTALISWHRGDGVLPAAPSWLVIPRAVGTALGALLAVIGVAASALQNPTLRPLGVLLVAVALPAPKPEPQRETSTPPHLSWADARL